ncbi:MAG: isoprenylcysteine carboxylmethyltransferase family protein [Planctomycetes bacterium]|nr:isoprenylcysteine carboxylmethyltransferase family protein [Planctomycetota bacterium]
MLLAYHIAILFVTITALVRVAVIVVLKFRQARYRAQAVAVPRTWQDLCTVPEPFLLGGVSAWLLFSHDFSVEPSGTQLGLCVGGLALSVLAGVLLVTSGWVFPSVSTGHYVLPDQEIISKGPYGQVRHPLYAGAFLVWFSLALAFFNLPVLLITLLYVIPSYLIYIRAEEEMLLRHLGDAYATYCARVGMLFPRIRR